MAGHLRAALATAATAALAASAGLIVGTAPVGAAPAACPATTSWFATAGKALVSVDDTGKQLASVTTSSVYYDIAFGADGKTLYGVPGTGSTIDTINTTNGTATGVAVTGAAAGKSINSLTALPSGVLLAGGSALYEIAPKTGTSTASSYALPASTALGGDLVTLPDGDVLAALSTGNLARLHPDGTSTVIGNIPDAYALSLSGGSVIVGTSGGALVSLAAVPTAASTSALTTTPLSSDATVSYYGGASIQNSGECNVPVTVADSASTAAGKATNVAVLANDSSGGSVTALMPTSLRLVDGSNLVRTLTVDGVGVFTATDDGAIAFTPADGYAGDAKATYSVGNDAGQTAQGSVTVTVAAAPTSSAAAASSSSNGGGATTDAAGSAAAAGSSSQVVPTAVPAGFDRSTDGPGVALLLGGLCLAAAAGFAGNLVRTRRQH